MLYEATKKVIEEANELKDLCVDQMFDPIMLKNMSSEEFELFKKMYKLTNDSLNLVLEQAKLFDEMDKKLDRIMKKLGA